jgi:hypothetical protein
LRLLLLLLLLRLSALLRRLLLSLLSEQTGPTEAGRGAGGSRLGGAPEPAEHGPGWLRLLLWDVWTLHALGEAIGSLEIVVQFKIAGDVHRDRDPDAAPTAALRCWLNVDRPSVQH